MTTPTSAPTPVKPSYRPQRLLILGIVLLLAALGGGYLLGLGNQSTDDAYVDGNIVQVTAQVSGTVTVIGGDNTDHIDAHALLVTLNPVDAEIQYQRAQSNLARAVRQARTQYYQVQQL